MKSNQKSNAEAFDVHSPDKKTGDVSAMLKVKGESEGLNNQSNKRCKNAIKSEKKSHTNNNNRKCAIEAVLNPDGEIPEQYFDYAKEQGLFDPKRTFLDWANWWVSENGRKAGKHGWLQTWKARVRKDVDRQMVGNKNHKGRGGNGDCATTAGARLALNRRRNKRGKI
ncbi:MAG: hypothetical protein JKY84_02660 [Emcibacteraceae bacterium]|nr:hypothetical protein [Emcibacteraceae bacterium]